MSEFFEFDIIPSDDPDVREADQGFLTEVSWTVTAPEGGKSHGVRRVLVPSTADAVVQLGSLYEPTEIPAVTAQRIIDGGTASAPLYDIRIRHDDIAGWAAEDPILSLGEEGIDTDTGTRKVGDGVTAWSDLPDRLGDEADARAAADAALDGRVGALEVAPPAHTHPLADVTDAGTAAAADVGDFATAAQGALADSASQPGHAHAGADITSDTVAYARLPVGTTAGTLAAGDDSRITGAAQKSANLSDLANASTARTNLGLTDSAVVGALPIPDPGSYYPTDTLTAALQLIGGRERYGTGSPLGAVSAPPGTYYTDTAGTNGAWRWLKTSGTGNAGWQPVYADTGWRNVSTSVTNAVLDSGGALHIKRTANVVTLRIVLGLLPSGTGLGSTIYLPPTGFVPRFLSVLARGRLRANATVIVDVGIVDGFGLYVPNLPSGSFVAVISWTTDDAWPTTLPGTAA